MKYHDITHDDMMNGMGLRVCLWCSGCEHHCKNCQNQQTWEYESGIPFDKEAKKELFCELKKDYISGITLTGGDPLAIKNLKEILDLVNEIRKKYPIPQDIVTVESENHNMLNEKTDESSISYPKKTIWIYSGYEWEKLMCPVITDDFNPDRDKIIKMRQDIIKQCDVFVDGRYIDELRDVSLHWRGSSNQRVIDVQKSLKEGKVILFDDK